MSEFITVPMANGETFAVKKNSPAHRLSKAGWKCVRRKHQGMIRIAHWMHSSGDVYPQGVAMNFLRK